MKLKFITAIALCAMAMISCDEETTIGDSLTNEKDKLVVTTHNFNILTRSVAVDSVFSRERQGYIGKVKDPETNTYVKSEFTSQFNMMENTINDLPKRENVLSLDENGNIIAESCYINILFDVSSSYGDTLTSMKLRVSELDRPIESEKAHFTNFDPKENGYLRQGGLQCDKVFSIRNLNLTDSIRNLIESTLHTGTTANNSTYYDELDIVLDEPYTDKNGVTYNNYGTYILRNLYDHPEYYKNSYSYIHNICPGFHFETIDGLGVMVKIWEMNMYVNFKADYGGEVGYPYLRTTSTEEVVQSTKVTNDKEAIQQLVEDNSCTYLKSPAGIYTEVTLPVDDICTSHPTDSLLTAKVIFQRLNNMSENPELAFAVPDKLLLIEKDSLDSFFKGNSLYNNLYAYQVSLTNNAYTFPNISNLLTRMYNEKKKGMASDPDWVSKHPDWNKALLVPIDVINITSLSTTIYGTQTTETPIATENKLGLSSTRLVKGSAENPIKMEVIYAKFKE